jgi:hypothetical protein
LESGAFAKSWSSLLAFSYSTKTLVDTYALAFGSADVVNSSWGLSDPTGTNVVTKVIDGLAYANPHTTMVVAAGNTSSGTAAAGSVQGPASGYNCISVGALDNSGTNTNTYDTIGYFSDRGPQSYSQPGGATVTGVRAAVDLVAPGTQLVSAYYGGATGGNSGGTADGGPNYYSGGLAGTSFAAPIVAGGVALLNSAAYVKNLDSNAHDARVIRAVLMNSADKLSGWSNGQAVTSNANGVGGLALSTTQSLDWILGAGRMNLSTAYDQYLSGDEDINGLIGGTIGARGWDYGSISGVGSHNDYVFNTALAGGTIMDVTLDWFRDRSVNTVTDLTSDSGYANLDLQVWDAGFQHLIATSDSLYNDAEELHFLLPSSGIYGLRVVYNSQMFGTPVAEPYGLAWSATAVPEPAALALLAVAATCLATIAWRKRPGRR